jgi:hypothetical protein
MTTPQTCPAVVFNSLLEAIIQEWGTDAVPLLSFYATDKIP